MIGSRLCIRAWFPVVAVLACGDADPVEPTTPIPTSVVVSQIR